MEVFCQVSKCTILLFLCPTLSIAQVQASRAGRKKIGIFRWKRQFLMSTFCELSNCPFVRTLEEMNASHELLNF